jgi:hypothetical protein
MPEVRGFLVLDMMSDEEEVPRPAPAAGQERQPREFIIQRPTWRSVAVSNT